MTLPKYLTTVTTFSKILAMILLIILPIIGFVLGMTYQKIRTISQENVINILPTPTISSMNQISPTLSLIDSETKILVEKICQNKKILNLTDYEKGEISKCGIYYGIYPPTNLMDAPIIIVNSKGNYVTSCGGMPRPNGQDKENPACSINCQSLNLTLCSSDIILNKINKTTPNSPPDTTSNEPTNIGTYKGIPVKP